LICVAGFNDPGRRDVSGSHDRRRDEYDWGLLVLRIRVKCAQIRFCSLSHVSQDRETVTRILRYFISKVQSFPYRSGLVRYIELENVNLRRFWRKHFICGLDQGVDVGWMSGL
jgi:hypothetical protein